MKSYQIAVIKGDGIGPEIIQSAMAVLNEACGANVLQFSMLDGGAEHYRKSGKVLPEETFTACQNCDAILHGAAGLPDVTYEDRTEVGNELHLQLRSRLDLYANMRPVKLLAGVRSPLHEAQPGSINYVIIRENTEGLYASRGAGVRLRDESVSDTLVVTRKGVERVARFALDLARKRPGAPIDGVHRLTVCDKANILRSYAFFRSICEEVVATSYPDIAIDYAYADAMALHLIKRPDYYDVIVAENMLGDIISDLGAATVGGLGIAPSGEIGDSHGLFQGAHGSAPDIGGQDVASPIATILSAVLMLHWLAGRYEDNELAKSAERIENAVETVLSSGEILPRDLGGDAHCTQVTEAICRSLV
jgi:3-isopropylmalate dehydrogenase